MKLVKYIISFVVLYLVVLIVAICFNVGLIKSDKSSKEITSYLVLNNVASSDVKNVEATTEAVSETASTADSETAEATEAETEAATESADTGETDETIYFNFRVNVFPQYVLHVRNKPSMEGDIIGYLHKDDTGIIIERDGDWAHINCTVNDTFYDGYVNMPYIYVLDPNTGEILSD